MCNDLPKLANIDGGVVRRIEVVDFPSKFIDNPHPTPNNPHQYKMDMQLGSKLKQWNLLFLLKLLSYYRLYDKEGTKAPNSVSQATNVYVIDNDIIQKWFCEDLVECDEVIQFNNFFFISQLISKSVKYISNFVKSILILFLSYFLIKISGEYIFQIFII